MLSPQKFYEHLISIIEEFSIINRNAGHIMHDPSRRDRQNRDYINESNLTIEYKEKYIAVQIFINIEDDKAFLLCQLVKGADARSSNTAEVTLTNTNINKKGIYYVNPSLKQCSNKLSVAPNQINGFPKLGDEGFLVGKLGVEMISAVFEVSIAKHESIKLSRRSKL